ncbi:MULTISPECIES: multidrug effflux MFS transporter [unclassified Curtobacterium]|uniref:multidrug effflux MFS transporter n=1 Tax=unclassified Curtobacterium TaxID=257496 RepID=UPI000DA9114F|nr:MULTISPECIES: multidrug effflux MFS transporter [unclassified Curtobacterium]PZE26498.1 Bcr/CflA family drug resistance efflux transporter [Curtobacterium sp. MCBD17_028]PZE74243.1 Bcr/CflA family drug resistance efflux transporter [Curtobacterium sp. MCBD17_019]PZF58588.1 Bcr/CflA family drug resistance efflux transporter [Curtobacterium sp. MCBD17_034]PZF64363.1 Bcr/CflA family drug resistance efflux transporter [Curtobacterium sp. MCBD17_013]PZM34578.1 Bcr/CflA family drug resistance eff
MTAPATGALTVVHPGDALRRSQRLVYVVVLGALTALGPFTIDLYLPAFPSLERAFDISAGAVQLTLTATTVGFAVGQLLVGPWSDRVGRRLPLILATSLHIVASVAASLAPNLETLAVLRFLQGMGAAAGVVVAMAMVRDLFGGIPLVRMLSRLAMVNGLAPILAPLIGSQMLRVVDWRGVFVFLACYGAVVIIAMISLIVETLPRERRHDVGHASVRDRYRALFSDRVFVGVALIGAMVFSGLFSYLSASPFLFQQVYGLSTQQYGVLFAVNSLGVVIGVQVSSRLARRVGPQWILACSTAVLLVSAVAIAVFDSVGVGRAGVFVPLWFFICACGFSFPQIQVLGLAAHGKEAATAASLLGAMNFGVAGIISPVVGLLGIGSAVPMAEVMAATAVVAVFVLWFVVRPRTVPALSH